MEKTQSISQISTLRIVKSDINEAFCINKIDNNGSNDNFLETQSIDVDWKKKLNFKIST